MTLTGGCNCGAVRFEVTGEIPGAGYCHCKRCQRRSGSGATASAFVPRDGFRLTAGEDVVRAWSPDEGNHKWFCPRCGSPVYGTNERRPGFVMVRLGVFDEDPGVRPGVRIYTDYAAPWEPIPDDELPRMPEGLQA